MQGVIVLPTTFEGSNRPPETLDETGRSAIGQTSSCCWNSSSVWLSTAMDRNSTPSNPWVETKCNQPMGWVLILEHSWSKFYLMISFGSNFTKDFKVSIIQFLLQCCICYCTVLCIVLCFQLYVVILMYAGPKWKPVLPVWEYPR